MGFPVYTTVELLARLTGLKGIEYPASPNQARIHLYKNNVGPDANMTPATFEEATYDDYAALPITMGTPSLNDQGLVVNRSNLLTWSTAGGIAPETIYGIYITDKDDAVVLAAQQFDTPQTVGGALPQSISGVWRTSEPLTSYGWIDVES